MTPPIPSPDPITGLGGEEPRVTHLPSSQDRDESGKVRASGARGHNGGCTAVFCVEPAPFAIGGVGLNPH